MSGDLENESYHAEYCEWCGELFDAPADLVQEAGEQVTRVSVLEAVKSVAEHTPVVETVATEERDCDCGGQVVKRYYACGQFPEPAYEPSESELSGRDPAKDALIEGDDGLVDPRDAYPEEHEELLEEIDELVNGGDDS